MQRDSLKWGDAGAVRAPTTQEQTNPGSEAQTTANPLRLHPETVFP